MPHFPCTFSFRTLARLSKGLALAAAFSLLSVAVGRADDDVVYRLELGAGAGVGFSLNDVNTKFYGSSNLAGGLVARFPLNPRMAVKLGLNYLKVSGSTDNVDDYYPTPSSPTVPFTFKANANLYDFSALYELHFLPYGWTRGYQGFRRLVPYIQAGLGLTYSDGGKAFAMNVPVGVGVKAKVAPRVNVGLSWTFHFSPNDKLEGLEAPHGIRSSEFRNKDHYSLTLVTFTYDLSPKCPTCNKD